MYFEDLDLSDNILDALYDMRFEKCTPIQEHTIPPILEGRDVLGIAQTGTGKTAAYLLPILSLLDDGCYAPDSYGEKNRLPFKRTHINCVIMSPTRELAQQIDQAMQGFGYYLDDISSVPVYGGNDGNRFSQEQTAMRSGADMLIATPGRLISHMQLGNLDLSHCSFFVLDEADRMLDMGFYDDIMTIVRKLPKERQTIMFSATMPENIRRMAKAIMRDPKEVQIAVSRPPESIKQMHLFVDENKKVEAVLSLLNSYDPSLRKKIIIFGGKKQRVKDLARTLRTLHIDARAMHSDLEQNERDQVMLDFKNGKVGVLVATDVVSRGIDVTDVPLVINYDVPRAPEDYVHRIGRTARAENSGEAMTLVSPDDMHYWKRIERFLQSPLTNNPSPKAYESATRSGKGCSGGSRHSSRNRGAHPHKSKGPNRGARHSGSKPRSANN